MVSSWRLCLFLFFFICQMQFLVLISCQTSYSPLRTICGTTGNYTIDSTYQSNLKTVLSNFVSGNGNNGFGFYNLYEGQDPDKFNGVVLCRGDVDNSVCSSCVNASIVDLPNRCPDQKEATIWYEYCMLRYSNTTIYSNPDSNSIFYTWNHNNATNASQFNSTLTQLLFELRDNASSGNSSIKFAVGQANLTVFETLYALVQCTPDLSKSDCEDCLSTAIRDAPTYMYGYRGGRFIGRSCNFRYEAYQFYNTPSSPASPAPPPQPPVPAAAPLLSPPPNPSDPGNSTTRTIIVTVVSTVAGVILIVFISIFLKMRNRTQNIEIFDGIENEESLRFDFATIRLATEDFSDANKLGQGGFGAVYKGRLSNGQEIAVKRLSINSGQGHQEFKNEVLLVAKLQHRNLVRLLGFCLDGDERLLIYEFVPNTSLDHFLFDLNRSAQLDWERRSKIIGGIARGLLYLHEDSRLRIIHRDMKTSNILLDADMNPKIADFGMARLFSFDEVQGDTNRIVGTYGYMAPEYAMHGQFSVKSDVYSFGVIVLELVSGQKNGCFRNGENIENLISYTWESWREGTAFNMIDPAIKNGSNTEILRCIHMGLLCVQDNIAVRPTMAFVVSMLNSYSVPLPIPSQPAFFMHNNEEPEAPLLLEQSFGTTLSSDQSVNGASITDLQPR